MFANQIKKCILWTANRPNDDLCNVSVTNASLWWGDVLGAASNEKLVKDITSRSVNIIQKHKSKLVRRFGKTEVLDPNVRFRPEVK